MLVPLHSTLLSVTVPDTMAHAALKGLDAKLNRMRALNTDVYFNLWSDRRTCRATGIEGGWQRVVFTFPDGSLVVLWADYGYNPRPNQFHSFAVATLPEYLPNLT